MPYMSYYDFDFVKECYCSKDLDTEQKIKKMREKFPQLTSIYEDDLRILFTDPLPLIEAVEIKTKFGGNDSACEYVAITKMPEEISADIQKAIMRIGACLGGFEVEKWGIGYLKTDAMKKHFSEYMNSHPVGYVLGEKAGYPKVFEICREVDDEASNECYSISKLIGIILS